LNKVKRGDLSFVVESNLSSSHALMLSAVS
jgi:hypothetical protein